MKSRGSSVLDDDDRGDIFSDESAESGEVLADGACVWRGVRYGVLRVSSSCFFLAEK